MVMMRTEQLKKPSLARKCEQCLSPKVVYQVSCTTRVILNIFSIIHMGIHQGQTINMKFCCNLLRYLRENIQQKHPDCANSILVHSYFGHTNSKPLISFTTDPTWFFVLSPKRKFNLKG